MSNPSRSRQSRGYTLSVHQTGVWIYAVPMQAFFSWITSQSGVSLLVALIALGGVLMNNHAAEERRRADQAAADQRRKDDQTAEDERRKADDERRERERREQLQREDWERQRRAVVNCIREITKAADLVSERASAAFFVEGGNPEHVKSVKAVEITRFKVEATTQLTLLDIEVTQPHVRAQIHVLWEQIVRDYQPLLKARSRGDQAWVNQAMEMQPLSDLARRGIRALTLMARSALLEDPEHMAKQPVVPINPEKIPNDMHSKSGAD